MRTAGLTMTDMWATRVLNEPSAEVEQYDGCEATINVYVESVMLCHHGADVHYRPYLHALGELRTIRPHVVLPYDISTVTYQAGHGESVDMFYEFDNDQLTALTQRGYFSRFFHVPNTITGVEWELPAVVDLSILAPNLDEAPIVFTRVHDLASLRIDAERSGYDLVEFFVDHAIEAGPRAAEADYDDGLDHDGQQTMVGEVLRQPSRVDIERPLFSEEEMAWTQQNLDDLGHTQVPSATQSVSTTTHPVQSEDVDTRSQSTETRRADHGEAVDMSPIVDTAQPDTTVTSQSDTVEPDTTVETDENIDDEPYYEPRRRLDDAHTPAPVRKPTPVGPTMPPIRYSSDLTISASDEQGMSL